MKVFGSKLEETEDEIKTEGQSAEEGKISAHRASPLQLAALTTPLSLAWLSGLSGGVHFKSSWQPEPIVMGSSTADASFLSGRSKKHPLDKHQSFTMMTWCSLCHPYSVFIALVKVYKNVKKFCICKNGEKYQQQHQRGCYQDKIAAAEGPAIAHWAEAAGGQRSDRHTQRAAVTDAWHQTTRCGSSNSPHACASSAHQGDSCS